MSALIEVQDLTKVYPDGTRAVDDVSFEVQQGETFGFLGPNGAGKTTTIRILVTLLPKTGGAATVGGFDVERQPERVRSMKEGKRRWRLPVYRLQTPPLPGGPLRVLYPRRHLV